MILWWLESYTIFGNLSILLILLYITLSKILLEDFWKARLLETVSKSTFGIPEPFGRGYSLQNQYVSELSKSTCVFARADR
jgi:hypothetical protein